jgi:DNA-3-methyladenine glycosylase I
MVRYHDVEWGVPQRDERTLFEFILLEGAQAGLSWRTVLNKRERYRVVFDGFDPAVIARYDDDKLATVLADPGIIRNRAKVAGAVTNARAWLELRAVEGDPVAWLWSFVDGRAIQNGWTEMGAVPASTPLSDAMSKELKRRGFTFVGTTIIYSLLQACGLVNDHLVSCPRHQACAALGR